MPAVGQPPMFARAASLARRDLSVNPLEWPLWVWLVIVGGLIGVSLLLTLICVACNRVSGRSKRKLQQNLNRDRSRQGKSGAPSLTIGRNKSSEPPLPQNHPIVLAARGQLRVTARAASLPANAKSDNPATKKQAILYEPLKTGQEKFIVKVPYAKQLPDELSLVPGDSVMLSKVYTDGWCEGVSHTAGGPALFPLWALMEESPVSPKTTLVPTSGLPGPLYPPQQYTSVPVTSPKSEFPDAIPATFIPSNPPPGFIPLVGSPPPQMLNGAPYPLTPMQLPPGAAPIPMPISRPPPGSQVYVLLPSASQPGSVPPGIFADENVQRTRSTPPPIQTNGRQTPTELKQGRQTPTGRKTPDEQLGQQRSITQYADLKPPVRSNSRPGKPIPPLQSKQFSGSVGAVERP
ncbi:hypothetical protein BJ742DRAFT_208224 [Cladochytrium replicatum]|nr:hypothetical protein BJ742DRAFT_208224 [Cladochytrium replicatum]